jgi:hypothetical protein
MVTKTEVGLGNVENYGVATNTDAVNSSITNKYITPNTLIYAINTIFNQTSNTQPGIVRLNIGTSSTDDDDTAKALTAKGFNTVISNNSSFNKLHESLVKFNKEKMVSVTSATGTNSINIVTNPSLPTEKIHGFLTFTANATNTGNVQIATNGGTYLNVVGLDGQNLAAGVLLINKVYTVYALKNTFVLLNPTQLDAVGNIATQLKNGLMSTIDKTKLDSIIGSNTGDETTNSILSKLNGVVLDCGILT